MRCGWEVSEVTGRGGWDSSKNVGLKEKQHPEGSQLNQKK
jgi:hypothetical protein